MKKTNQLINKSVLPSAYVSIAIGLVLFVSGSGEIRKLTKNPMLVHYLAMHGVGAVFITCGALKLIETIGKKQNETN